MRFNETYSQVQGKILLMGPLPSVNRVYSLLIQDESQRSIGHSTGAYIGSTALATKSSVGAVGFGNTMEIIQVLRVTRTKERRG